MVLPVAFLFDSVLDPTRECWDERAEPHEKRLATGTNFTKERPQEDHHWRPRICVVMGDVFTLTFICVCCLSFSAFFPVRQMTACEVGCAWPT